MDSLGEWTVSANGQSAKVDGPDIQKWPYKTKLDGMKVNGPKDLTCTVHKVTAFYLEH